MKQAIFFTLALIVFLSALGSAYYVFFIRKEKIDVSMKYSSINNSENLTDKPKENDNNQEGSLKVQSANNNKDDSSLPTPEQFSVYENESNKEVTSYIDVVVGEGESAQTGDTVAMIYKGWLTNGKLFDQSRKNQLGQLETFNFTLGSGQVIKGWDEGIVGMKQGGKRRLIIPSSSGYGSTGQGPIPPDSMLIFDVELIQLQKNYTESDSGALLP